MRDTNAHAHKEQVMNDEGFEMRERRYFDGINSITVAIWPEDIAALDDAMARAGYRPVA